MRTEFFSNGRPQNGLTYEQYLAEWNNYLERTDKNSLSELEKVRYDYKTLNKQRSLRINKTYKVSEELISLLTQLDTPQVWMVLTENWCGDSAQNLPYIAKMAEQSDKIDLRILYRDENLDIMDQYLTNGNARSIPKLIALDIDGNELFQWGPRPEKAQDFVLTELTNGREKQDVMKDLHLWYAKNRGEEIDKEFTELVGSGVKV